jgi:hypothetical protein
MQQVPTDISAAFRRRLDQAQVPADQRPVYHKWARFYLDFCTKYSHSPASPTSLGLFLNKLASKATMIYPQTVPIQTPENAARLRRVS